MARKYLVDGAKAYNERKFEEAEEKFRTAVEYDPEGSSFESKTAQLFLARTIHSGYAGNRDQTEKAEEAIREYEKALTGFINDLKEKREAVAANPQDEDAGKELAATEGTIGSIVRSVASLYENLGRDDKWKEWQLLQAKNAEIPNSVRANAYIGMAAKLYTCANDITDSKDVKKTVEKGEDTTYEFKKPADNEDFDKEFDKLKKCVDEGTGYVDEAIKLDPESDSAWSYRTSLLVQKSRIAEMDGDNAKRDEYRKASDEAKKKFEELADLARKKKEKEEAEAKAKEAEEAGKNKEAEAK